MPTRGARRTGAPAWHDPPAVHHMRVLRPADGIVAFYDGRVEGYRFAEGLNWVDDGALGARHRQLRDRRRRRGARLRHPRLGRARALRPPDARGRGVTRFVVVLSHKHLDHVAGTEAFADCEVSPRPAPPRRSPTATDADRGRAPWRGRPGIDPLVLPTRTFEDHMTLDVGRRRLELIHVDIHSDDAAVIWLPGRAPAARRRHAGGHRHLPSPSPTASTATWPTSSASGRPGPRPHPAQPRRPRRHRRRRLPEGPHRATQDYIRVLQRCRDEPALRDAPLAELIADSRGGRLAHVLRAL